MKYVIIHKDDEISNEIHDFLRENIKLEYDLSHPDYVIVVGGDGTFLSAVHQYPSAVFFAIHTGHLGFFANYVIEDLNSLVEDINSGKFQIERLDVISCEIYADHKEIKDFAVNEMTILIPHKPLILSVKIDDKKLETFRGTGLCISTAYGSTAYNKSLGGAVVDPKLQAFQLTEIAGINSNQYRTLSSPLVLSLDRTITLEAEDAIGAHITLDQKSYPLKEFKRATLKLKASEIALANHQNKFFIERIRRSFLTEKD